MELLIGFKTAYCILDIKKYILPFFSRFFEWKYVNIPDKL